MTISYGLLYLVSISNYYYMEPIATILKLIIILSVTLCLFSILDLISRFL